MARPEKPHPMAMEHDPPRAEGADLASGRTTLRERIVTGRLSLLTLAVMVGVGLVYLVTAFGLSVGTLQRPGPGLYPVLVGGMIMVFGVVGVLEDLLGRDDAGSMAPREGITLWRVLTILGALAAYVVLAPTFGHVVVSTLTTSVVIRILGNRPWWQVVVAALVLSVGSSLLFQDLLGMRLPNSDLLGR